MREKLKKLKENLDKLMLQKTKKQMIWYQIIFYIIFATGIFLLFPMFSKLDEFLLGMILALIYCFLNIIVGVYLGRHLTLAILRDDERKTRKLFLNGIRLNIVPATLNAYMKIGDIMQNIIAKKQKSHFCFTFLDPNEYVTFVDALIKDNKLAITAELIAERICISICYEGEYYHPKELEDISSRWFKFHFLIKK